MTIEIELELPKGTKKQIHEIEVSDDLDESEIDEAVYEYVENLVNWTWEKKDDKYWEDVFRPDTDEI